ncbi:MAG: DUF2177 family protein [Actinobacteria bacterium]|nr:DUF2177 family protein [Actinomycetota bacterium]NDG26369.1 DUF2177 family protein [Pseudomonadota bacterium]
MNALDYLITILLLICVDLVWLMTAGRLSLKMLAKIQGSPVVMRFWAATVVYIALSYLVMSAGTYWEAVGFGAATYAVYDFTSLATLKDYDWKIAVADTVWGGVLFGTVWYIRKKYLGFAG